MPDSPNVKVLGVACAASATKEAESHVGDARPAAIGRLMKQAKGRSNVQEQDREDERGRPNRQRVRENEGKVKKPKSPQKKFRKYQESMTPGRPELGRKFFYC